MTKFKYDKKTGTSTMDYDRKRDGRSVKITTPGKAKGSESWLSRLLRGGKR